MKISEGPINKVLGIDIGGTFTDIVFFDPETGEGVLDQVPSTPPDFHLGFFNAIKKLEVKIGLDLSDLHSIVHGTTVATNALLEGSLPLTGLVVTKGFRDLLEIGTQLRPSLYDMKAQKPLPIVPSRFIWEVSERVDREGNILTLLDTIEIEKIVEEVRKSGVNAVAICLIYSFLNSNHEHKIAKAIKKSIPSLYIAQSSEVCAELGEFPRANTTALNASLGPVVADYLVNLQRILAKKRFHGDLYIMQSNGGMATAIDAKKNTHALILSGPAAGVRASIKLSDSFGHNNLVTFDMGGTSCDICLISNGVAQIIEQPSSHERYPIQVPKFDIHTIGAGGGSIAYVDEAGGLHVGPESAGALPGPACYGKGGDQPTVTDAQVVLGKIPPDYFLGGQMLINKELAEDALVAKIGTQLGKTSLQCAQAITDISEAIMARSIRSVTTKKGFDPRDFSLTAFGGAGPLHACSVANLLGMIRVIIPVGPGAFSAYGLLQSDIQYDYVKSIETPVSKLSVDHLKDCFLAMESKGRSQLKQARIESNKISMFRYADLRYVGQNNSLRVSISQGSFSSKSLQKMLNNFFKRHEKEYGHVSLEDPVEIVAARISAIGFKKKPALETFRSFPKQKINNKIERSRSIFFKEIGDFVDTKIIRRETLCEGKFIEGPIIVEEPQSTISIQPGWYGSIDRVGNIILDSKGL